MDSVFFAQCYLDAVGMLCTGLYWDGAFFFFFYQSSTAKIRIDDNKTCYNSMQ